MIYLYRKHLPTLWNPLGGYGSLDAQIELVYNLYALTEDEKRQSARHKEIKPTMSQQLYISNL